jgi:hypothetical protein
MSRAFRGNVCLAVTCDVLAHFLCFAFARVSQGAKPGYQGSPRS